LGKEKPMTEKMLGKSGGKNHLGGTQTNHIVRETKPQQGGRG